MEKTPNYLVLFVVSLFSVVSFWPWIVDLFTVRQKDIDEDMKGDNKRWDFPELAERNSLRVSRSAWICVWVLLICTILFDMKFEPWLWGAFFSATIGTSGISAYLVKLKSDREHEDRK